MSGGNYSRVNWDRLGEEAAHAVHVGSGNQGRTEHSSARRAHHQNAANTVENIQIENIDRQNPLGVSVPTEAAAKNEFRTQVMQERTYHVARTKDGKPTIIRIPKTHNDTPPVTNEELPNPVEEQK